MHTSVRPAAALLLIAAAGCGSDSVTNPVAPGFLGGTSTDPYNSSRTTTVSTLGSCTNSSIGEIAGDTLVSYNMAFINAYLAAHPQLDAVPEPATWAMLMVGFGLVGGALRSGRRRGVAVAA